jgi:hypothetical protein
MVPHPGRGGTHGRLLPLLWFPCSLGTLMRTLTRSRSADFHRATMLKLLAAAAVTFLLWSPLAPVRYVTADLLALTADQLRR